MLVSGCKAYQIFCDNLLLFLLLLFCRIELFSVVILSLLIYCRQYVHKIMHPIHVFQKSIEQQYWRRMPAKVSESIRNALNSSSCRKTKEDRACCCIPSNPFSFSVTTSSSFYRQQSLVTTRKTHQTDAGLHDLYTEGMNYAPLGTEWTMLTAMTLCVLYWVWETRQKNGLKESNSLGFRVHLSRVPKLGCCQDLESSRNVQTHNENSIHQPARS